MARRIFIGLPKEVYNNLLRVKKSDENDLSKYLGKEVKLTNTKYINALILKHDEIKGIIPFDKGALLKYSKLKRGNYDIK